MSVTTRPASINDLPAILEIVNYSIIHTTANYNYEPQSLEMQQKWFQQKQALGFPVLVAVEDGVVAGYSTFGTFREKIGYQYTVEHSVYVANDRTGNGIGKILLSELIEVAKRDGYHTMIGGIDASNDSSIAFHSKFGFTECGIIREAAYKFDRWLDLLFMQLLLK